MAYTGFALPNASAAAFPLQAELFAQDLQVMAEAFRDNGVLNGCAVSQRGAGANMSVDVAAGNIVREGATVVVAGGNVVISAAHASLPRIDIVSANNVGALVATSGTAAAVPEPPTIPQVSNINNIVLAFVYIPAADTAVNTNQITDKRAFVTASGGAGTGTVTTTGTPATGNLTQFSGSTSITNGNLSGNVTTAGTLVTTIAAQAVTYARIQNVSAASRLLGRGSAGGAGSPEEIIIGTNLTMTGTTLSATGGGGSGDVVGPSASTDGEVAVYNSTTGKIIKRSNTLTGVGRVAAGVLSAAEPSGDVTTSGSNAATVAANAISYAKMQDVAAASRLLGRGSAAGAGDPQEITLGTNLSMSGTTLNASGSGTTPTGTGFTHITAGAQDAAAKLVDTADVNADQITYAKLQNVSAASRLLGRGSAGGAGDPEELTLGTNLTMSGTTLNASGSGGSIVVRKNTGADVGTRPRLNLIEGSNVTLTVADDAGGNEVDITIAAAGGSSSNVNVALASDVVHSTGSVTLEDITGFTFSTTASATEIWRVDVSLLTTMNTAGGSSTDFKFGWTFPGGVTGFWASQVEREQGAAGSQPLAPSIAAILAFASASTIAQGMINFTALIASNGNAGAVQLRFAQNSATAGAVATMKRLSSFEARKVAT